MRTAVGVMLDPNLQQLVVSPGVGVQRRQAMDIGPKDLGGPPG
jgi:hypothetical protein